MLTFSYSSHGGNYIFSCVMLNLYYLKEVCLYIGLYKGLYLLYLRYISILHVQKYVVAYLNHYQVLQELFKQLFLCTKIYA